MLNLHSGGELIELPALQMMPTPQATTTHHPLAHFDLINMVKFSLQYYGHEVVEEQHAIDKDGDRYFGILSLRSTYGDYTDVCGLRNTHDKSYPAGIAFGSSVFVCSNLAFISDQVIKRRHTKNIKRDLVGIIASIVEPLQGKRIAQAGTFEAYKNRVITDAEFDHLIMTLYRRGALNVTRIADVVEAYERPPFDWGDHPTAWRAFNAVTYALRGKVAEAPQLTQTLHQTIDQFVDLPDGNQLTLLQ